MRRYNSVRVIITKEYIENQLRLMKKFPGKFTFIRKAYAEEMKALKEDLAKYLKNESEQK